MSRSSYALPFLALAVCLVFAGEAQAQESTTRGFTLGVHASGASLSIESAPGADAGGGGIRLGYGLNRSFTLFAQFDGAQFDVSELLPGEWTMGHADRSSPDLCVKAEEAPRLRLGCLGDLLFLEE